MLHSLKWPAGGDVWKDLGIKGNFEASAGLKVPVFLEFSERVFPNFNVHPWAEMEQTH